MNKNLVPFSALGLENLVPSLRHSISIRVKKEKSWTNAGVFVVDNNRKIVSLNRKLISMWSLPQQIVSSQNDWQVVKFISKRCENSANFLIDIRKIYKQPDLDIKDSIKLKDGRIFERITKPQWSEGKIVGRIWMFREISLFESQFVDSTNH